MEAVRISRLVTLRALVWGLEGALFGTLGARLLGVFLPLNLPTGVARLAVTAAFYAAMQVALIGTLARALAGIATPTP